MRAKRISLRTTTSPQIGEAIEKLLWSGLWGTSKSEVIGRLLSHAIRDVLSPEVLAEIAADVQLVPSKFAPGESPCSDISY